MGITPSAESDTTAQIGAGKELSRVGVVLLGRGKPVVVHIRNTEWMRVIGGTTQGR